MVNDYYFVIFGVWTNKVCSRHNRRMKIAIIGTGISGLSAAYLLCLHHDVIVYEKNAYVGGHSRTIEVPIGDQQLPVDTGFIVFNNWNYPNLMGLFKELGVPYQKSDMSFGVSIDHGWLEYGSSGLFAQKRNLLRPSYYAMLADIVRFNQRARAFLEQDSDMSLQECLDRFNMGEWFRRYYLLAMGAAIWSCSIQTVMTFPARTFLQFFNNHGLLSLNKRPQWYTVTGGSREYLTRLTARFQDQIKVDCGVRKVIPHRDRWVIQDTHGKTETVDQIVFACHADETLNMIDSSLHDEWPFLKAFDYQSNRIIVHRDASFMPREKKCWASWVYLSEKQEDRQPVVSLSYWMNNLQGLTPEHLVLVTLNPGRRPQEALILDEHVFSHPIFDAKAIEAQQHIQTIQGKKGVWFCGAYQRYGFHEDGIVSAVNVAKQLGVNIPWE